MEVQKSCPECGSRILADSTSCRCGWQARGSGKSKAQPATCAWEEYGRPCGHRGVIGLGTGESQSYCRQHWDEMNGIAPKVRGNALPLREAKPGEPAWQYSGWDIERKRPVRAMPVRIVRDERETEDV